MRTLIRTFVILVAVALVAAGLAWYFARDEVMRIARDVFAPPGPVIDTSRAYSLEERIAEIGPRARAGLIRKFEKAGAAWPPTEVTLVAIKDENVLELHAKKIGAPWQRVHRYPVLRASGTAGPKLRQGDKQVPEGIYRVSALNPNSLFHVSLRLDYPNAFDQAMGAKDRRQDLGSDIMIHGKNASVGCLAMGDEAAEELFVLAHTVGLPKINTIIAPTDFRKGNTLAPPAGSPPWVAALYSDIANALAEFKS